VRERREINPFEFHTYAIVRKPMHDGMLLRPFFVQKLI
jgi:hypothetical protein